MADAARIAFVVRNPPNRFGHCYLEPCGSSSQGPTITLAGADELVSCGRKSHPAGIPAARV